MSEFIVYPNATVDAKGYTVVTPEVISMILEDLKKHDPERVEGFGLTVKYADLKALIEMAGHTVKEITLEKPDASE